MHSSSSTGPLAQSAEHIQLAPSPHMPQQQPQQQPRQRQQQEQRQAPNQKARKLRLACDACGAAKVKCGKERPRCERCIGSDLNCVYGPSMKHGKPQKKRQKRRQTGSQPSAAYSHSNHDSCSQQANFVQTGQAHYNDFQQQSLADLVGTTFPWGLEIDNPASTTSFPPPSSEYTTPPPRDQFWHQGTTPGHVCSSANGTITPSKTVLNNILDPADTPTHAISNTLSSQHFITAEPWKPIKSPSSPVSSLGLAKHGSFPQSPSQLDNSSSAGSHDCYARAISVLKSLHFESKSPNGDGSYTSSALSTTQPSIFPPPAPSGPTLDEILLSNQHTISTLFQLFKCPCARNPHMVMLHASIIARILYQDQLAAGVSSTVPIPAVEGLPSPAGSSPSMISPVISRDCASATPLMAAEPVKIGTYTPDEEDQKQIRRLFLLSNFKKTRRAVESFAAVGDEADGWAGGFHEAMTEWLRREVERSIREIEGSM